jgi:threonine synthase
VAGIGRLTVLLLARHSEVMKKTKLICTQCDKIYSIERVHPRCDVCNEPLEVEKVIKGKIKTGNIFEQTILDRYGDFFPFL